MALQYGTLRTWKLKNSYLLYEEWPSFTTQEVKTTFIAGGAAGHSEISCWIVFAVKLTLHRTYWCFSKMDL